MLLVLILAVVINLAGINTAFFTNDPSLYALLAKNMVLNNNYTNLMYHGADWLDKPHFPFWVVALSFNLFGINTVAYKLPALLFYLLGVRYTYLLAKKLYNADTALIAALVMLTAEHTILSNTDIRAEAFIIGLLMGSVYHFYALKEQFSVKHLLWGALFAACAVMTKGIYVLIPIGSAIIGDYLFKRDFKGLLQWRWLFAVCLTAVFILPEIYTLYIQFDLHPEKLVFGHRGVSGIRWFLWDSQFGRFNDTGYIVRAEHDYFFFIHTLLWAFAPWSFMLFGAVFISIKKIVKRQPLPEYVSLAGALPMWFIFSISQFQLPFYTNILFPFFAIVTASYLAQVFANNKGTYFKVVQYLSMAALAVIIIAGCWFIDLPGRAVNFVMPTLLLIVFGMYIFKYAQTRLRAVFLFSCCIAVWTNAFTLIVLYPTLVDYKGEIQAARYINKHIDVGTPIAAAVDVPDAFEFYLKRPVSFLSIDTLIAQHDSTHLILVEDTLKAQLTKQHHAFKLIQQFDNYPNEVLMLPFLMRSTRPQALNHFFLIALKQP